MIVLLMSAPPMLHFALLKVYLSTKKSSAWPGARTVPAVSLLLAICAPDKTLATAITAKSSTGEGSLAGEEVKNRKREKEQGFCHRKSRMGVESWKRAGPLFVFASAPQRPLEALGGLIKSVAAYFYQNKHRYFTPLCQKRELAYSREEAKIVRTYEYLM